MSSVFPSAPISPLKSHPAGEASQTSGGSVTSEGSSLGFRPVPKKRTFLSRRSSSQTESNGLGLDAQVGSAGVVPAPRRSLQRGSSGSSIQSKGQDEKPQKSVVSNQVSQSAPPSKSIDENSQQPLCDVAQVLSDSSLERERNPPSTTTRDRSVDDSSSDPDTLMKLSRPSVATHTLHIFRPATYTKSDASTDREIPQKGHERDDQTQREHALVNTVTGSIQDSDRKNNSSVSVGSAMRQQELSLTQSTVGEFCKEITTYCS